MGLKCSHERQLRASELNHPQSPVSSCLSQLVLAARAGWTSAMAERYLISKALCQRNLCTLACWGSPTSASQAEVPEGAAVPELVKLRQARDEKLAAAAGPNALLHTSQNARNPRLFKEKKQALEEKQKQRQERLKIMSSPICQLL